MTSHSEKRRSGDFLGAFAREAERQARVLANRVDHDPTARLIAGMIGRTQGRPEGVRRGVVHNLQGVYEGAKGVLHYSTSPAYRREVDRQLGALYHQAAQEARREGLGNYARRQATDFVVRTARQVNHDVNPRATPMRATIGEEFRRGRELGGNEGELAFDVGSTFLGGGMVAKGLRTLGVGVKAAKAEKYLAQGFSQGEAEYLARPYANRDRMGHHVFPRKGVMQYAREPWVKDRPWLKAAFKGLPQEIKDFRLPELILDSPFNVIEPRGISLGDMYELHARIDPKFTGARLARGMRSWRARRLGIEPYPMAGRIWHGTPGPMMIGAGAGLTTSTAAGNGQRRSLDR